MKAKKRTKIIIAVIAAVGLLFAGFCAVTYYAFSEYKIAESFCNGFLFDSWTDKVDYEMLSDELKEMIPRDEFELAKSGDAAAKHSMYKRIEGFKSKSAVKNDDWIAYSTRWIKFPFEDHYEYNGEDYYWDYYIDVVCFFGKIKVVNFGCVAFYPNGKRDDSALGVNSQNTNNNEKAITRIRFTETGGVDGRDNEWDIFQIDGCSIAIRKDNKFRKTDTYHISDEDYHALVDIDFSQYSGKTDNAEGIADRIYSNTSIIYEDGTQNKIEVNIPELQSKIYELADEYEAFPESGNIGEYAYKTINSNGYFEADFSGAGKYDKCFYLEKDSRPDSPLQVYIYGGEYSHGGYFMNVVNLKTENDTLYVTVNEGLYESEVYTEAIISTCCMVEIEPSISNVIVKNTGGCDFMQIENSSSDITP